ncbi:glutathione S-transferase [Acetobacter tropicalis]|uniref:glutathione S-transferase n=1 Tax=Acetobacter tropicalis TaxID=104102 RepID=UPI0039769483
MPDMSTAPILYSFRRCPYAMRARLALVASQTECVVREIRLAAKPEAMLAASPKGTVPVLVQPDSTVLEESLDIMRWALSQADPSHWLEGVKPQLIEQNDTAFKYHLDRYKYATRYGSDPAYHQAEAVRILRNLENILSVEEFLQGNHFGLTDAAIAPFVRQFAATDPAWFQALPLPAVQNWLNRFLTSRLFEQVMVRYAPWHPEDAPVWLLTAV